MPSAQITPPQPATVRGNPLNAGRAPSPLRAWVVSEFVALLDLLPAPTALVGPRGDILHATAAWQARIPPHDRLMIEGALRRARAASPGEVKVSLSAGPYAVVLSLVQFAGDDRPFGVALLAHAMPGTRPDWRALAEAHGLPTRMAEVAGLIAEGLTNDEIARRMGVSPATVRRQTERVLRRLGVERRSAVAARLAVPVAADAA